MSTHKKVSTAAAVGLAFLITAIPVAAKPTSKPKVKTPTAHVAKIKPATAHGPKATTPKVKTTGSRATTHGSKPTTTAVKPAKATAKGQAKATGPTKTKGSAKQAKLTTDRKGGSTRTTNVDGGPKDSRPTTNVDGDIRPTTNVDGDIRPTTNVDGDGNPTSTQTLSKAQRHLLKNDNLRAKMEARLPAGTNPVRAAVGFKNLGQFVAAVNVSNNHGIDFFALKNLMVAPNSMSLGQAMQQLKGTDPTAARVTADAALAAANADVAPATTTTTTKKAKSKDRN
jgi:hypothetical protein